MHIHAAKCHQTRIVSRPKVKESKKFSLSFCSKGLVVSEDKRCDIGRGSADDMECADSKYGQDISLRRTAQTAGGQATSCQ